MILDLDDLGSQWFSSFIVNVVEIDQVAVGCYGMNMILVGLCKTLITFCHLTTKLYLWYLEDRLEIRETIFRASSIPCNRKMCIEGFNNHLVNGVL